MIDNTEQLNELISRGTIRVQNSSLFSETPPPLPISFTYDKVEGMLLGLAIGDALGATSESIEPLKRFRLYGEIRDYLPGKRSDNRPVGIATDDTQLSFFTLEQLIEDNGLVPDKLARKFCKNRILGIGNTTRSFIKNYKDKDIRWDKAGLDSRGNGALMRIAPIVLPYLRSPHSSLYADAALDAMITHNNFANIASCVAFVYILWHLIGLTSPPKPTWWVDSFCDIACDLEGATCYEYPLLGYTGPLWKFTQEEVDKALKREIPVIEACNYWGSGADIFGTVPSVLYILAKYGHDPEEAIVRAVNDTFDNDTIACIVGAAVGALHGLSGIPERWVKRLTGRIREHGTGQVFRLVFHAKQIFWLASPSSAD